ncbi:MAG: RecQ family ATP-dependent DNA helicase [Desulforegulaceae bacterium]|nr:RecQ family ATP-dependent DNA helicase [Desulforegulaceae bacterium]
MKKQAEIYLKQVLNNKDAFFRDGQWESIEKLLDKNRVLVVQRTGWGKSMVYFLATKLLREKGYGATLLISPLLSLMRNQLEAAQRIGLTAQTINSTNIDQWNQIENKLRLNKVDLLLISPERLGNADFRQNVLANIAENIGLFVIDEAHCISDWGHDFRPDYRRIIRVLKAIPSNVPILATTATANNRVVNDIQLQLGENITLQKGSLVRKSLKLQNIKMPSPSARMAWLAQNIPNLPGSGIVYTLTQRDAERVSKWLKLNKISAEAYHSAVGKKEDSCITREELEQKLLNNKIKVLVATIALGMGFDKPDLGFVIHFQRPASVVHYYQQVGRAGRAVDQAYGILLCGKEDDHIANYFMQTAFPPQQHISKILNALDQSDNGLSVPEIQSALNLRKGQIDKTLKFLTIESPSPITKIGRKWNATVAAASYQADQEYINAITNIRLEEQKQMQDYMNYSGCLMKFLQTALDDPSPNPCGKCKNCAPSLLLNETYDNELAKKAALFLRRSYQPLKPRKQWPVSNIFSLSPLSGYKIPKKQQAKKGRALSIWRDAGWGKLVAHDKYEANKFSDELVTACVEMLKNWSPNPFPKWVTCIPSLINPDLVPDFAEKLAETLNLPFIQCIEKIRVNKEQKEMQNSYQQVKNLDGVFKITNQCLTDECLLVDDIIESGWTFTVAAALLSQAGCSLVYPMALALNSPRMD